MEEKKNEYRELRDDIIEIKTTMKFMSQQISDIGNSYKQLPDKVAAVEKHNVEVDAEIENIETRLKKVEDDKDALNKKVWGIIISAIAAAVIYAISQGVAIL